MASKIRKPGKFSKVTAVKLNARDQVGTPKASFAITPKNQREPRYKESWQDYADSEFEDLKEDLEKL
jgi:hypothetical protein